MDYLLAKLKPWQKTMVAFNLDFLVALFAFPAAYFLRYGQAFPDIFYSHKILEQSILIALVQPMSFYFFDMYRGIWRYASTPDLVRVIKGATFGVVLFFLAVFFYNRLVVTPRSIFIIDWILLVIGLGGWRLLYRILRDHATLFNTSELLEKVIVVGAGSGGDQLIREIRKAPSLNMKVVAMIDDDIGIRNKLLHGIPVMGGVEDIPRIVEKTKANQIFIAIPSASGEQIERIISACRDSNLKFKTLPRIEEILNGRVELSQLRDVLPEDLLGRKQIKLDTWSINEMIEGSKVLISGAGGSIGSEICNQVAKFRPKEIVLFEITELFLYDLEKKLKKSFPELKYHCVVGDIRNLDDVNQVFRNFKPEIVFHAAAYKHVPMMEINPTAAIKTNIFGTKLFGEKAVEYGVKRFVLVSTDKAVNPTNVMGATKRVAEMVCQDLQSKTESTKFLTVRFGNVLGSSGSVIPLFKEQINNGGPLTVTHPDIERYFMSISEASQLVLQAGAIGKGDELFVLDMGKAIKIADLAKNMITLSGLKINEDIEIEYIGLRPGEKLYEELLMDNETTLPTQHPQLRIAKVRKNQSHFISQLSELFDNLDSFDYWELRDFLQSIVPEYSPFPLEQSETSTLKVSGKVVPIH